MNLAAAAQSSIGRKLISGLTGLLLVGFVVGHLTGNLLLLVGPQAFNDYAYFLEHLFHGAGIYLAEAGLALVLAFHAWSGWSVWSKKWQARKGKYASSGSAGGASKKGMSSTSMLWTGLLLLLFIVVHIAQFKFGVVDDEARTFVMNGVEMKDLYGRVIDAFASPFWTGIYVAVMTALGVHIWHGAWSAFQSLGLLNSKYLPTVRMGSQAIAVILALGFLALPLYICFNNTNLQELDEEYLAKYQTAAIHATIGTGA